VVETPGARVPQKILQGAKILSVVLNNDRVDVRAFSPTKKNNHERPSSGSPAKEPLVESRNRCHRPTMPLCKQKGRGVSKTQFKLTLSKKLSEKGGA